MKDSACPLLCETVVSELRALSTPEGICQLALHDISRATGYSRRSIIRAIKGLVARGAVVVRHRYASDGTQLCNVYRVTGGHATHRAKGGVVCQIS